jgi:hypothetical protein
MEMNCVTSLEGPRPERGQSSSDLTWLLDRLASEADPELRALARRLESGGDLTIDGSGRLAALASGLRTVAIEELAREYLDARSSNQRSLARAALLSLTRGTPRVVWTTSAGALVKVSAGGRHPARIAHMLKRSVAAMMGAPSV